MSRRYFASLERRVAPIKAPVSWWTTSPRAGFAELCASQILRMSFSPQATHVTGMTIAGGSAKPAKSEVTPIGGYTT